jgi:hypothetical protein
MVEHRTLNPLVEGSSPSAPTKPTRQIADSHKESAISALDCCALRAARELLVLAVYRAVGYPEVTLEVFLEPPRLVRILDLRDQVIAATSPSRAT